MLQSAVGIYSVQVGMLFVIWIASDFFEFFYHQLGHRYKFLWEQVCRGHSGTGLATSHLHRDHSH